MGTTKIEYVDKVWNPITGCSPVSDGCRNCYAKRMAYRIKGRYGYPKDDPFKVTFHPDRLDEPLHWKKPSRIFVCSMGDIAHKDIKENWFENIMGTISDCQQHLFLILTKRPERLKKLLSGFWPFHNFWLGVSVEDQPTADERISQLLQIPAAHRFVSVEPMLGPVDLNGGPHGQLLGACDLCNGEDPKCPGCHGADGLNWVICGGETGPHARPLHPDWVRSLRDQCQASGVPFFFKGWGEWGQAQSWGECVYGSAKVHCWGPSKGDPLIDPAQWTEGMMVKVGKKKSGRLLDGREWNEMPDGK